MGPIEIFTFGGMRLSRSEADLTEQMGTRHRALLIYLVCQDSPVPRRELLAILGRGGSAEREMKGLRRAIDWLNENVPDLGIELTKKGVQVSGDISLDVHELSDAIRRMILHVTALHRANIKFQAETRLDPDDLNFDNLLFGLDFAY